MAPSPSTWNPRPSTLDKKIDSLFPTTFLEIAVYNLAPWAPLGRGWFLFYGLM